MEDRSRAESRERRIRSRRLGPYFRSFRYFFHVSIILSSRLSGIDRVVRHVSKPSLVDSIDRSRGHRRASSMDLVFIILKFVFFFGLEN